MAHGTRAHAFESKGSAFKSRERQEFFSLTLSNQMGPSCCSWVRKSKQEGKIVIGLSCREVSSGTISKVPVGSSSHSTEIPLHSSRDWPQTGLLPKFGVISQKNDKIGLKEQKKHI